MINSSTSGQVIINYQKTRRVYIYVSDDWGSHSWLDHSISTEDGNNIITNMRLLYGSVQSDHIPVAIEIDLQLAPDVEHGRSTVLEVTVTGQL